MFLQIVSYKFNAGSLAYIQFEHFIPIFLKQLSYTLVTYMFSVMCFLGTSTSNLLLVTSLNTFIIKSHPEKSASF